MTVVEPGGQGLGRSTAIMAAGTATSRVLGVVRASVLAGAIGLTAVSANAFALANVLPNIIYMLIAGGVLNAVLVPQVVRAYRSADGQEYVDRLLTLAGVIVLGVTVLTTAAAPLIVHLMSDVDDPGFHALATTFALWCIPQVFFYGLYTLLGQVLNARGMFGPYMWAPVVNNVIAIAGIGVFIAMFGELTPGGPNDSLEVWDGTRVAVLAGTATLGVVGQALVLVVPLYRSGFRYRPRGGWRGVGLGSAGRVAGWTFAALVIGQLGVVAVTRVASSAPGAGGGGSDIAGNAAYTYAFTFFMLPHSLVTVSLLTALFTGLSAHAAEGATAAVREDTSYGLRTIGVFTVFASAVVAVLAVPMVRVVLPRVSPAEVGALAPVVVALTAGLVALGAWSLFQRVHYAYEDARGLFWVQVAMAGVVVAGAYGASFVLEPRWWTAGAAAAIALSYVVGAVWGAGSVARRLGPLDGAVLRTHVRAVVAALAAAALGWPLSRLFGDLTSGGALTALLVCLLVGLVMLGVYVGLLRLMGVTELEALAAPVLARLGRSMSTPGRRAGSPRRAGGPTAHGGDRLDGVVIGRGTLLAGRYRLHQPASTDLPGVEAWDAKDQILDRPVRALVIREGRVSQAQDAARRAALVSDPRLLRVLDVGDHEGVAYTVTEPLIGRDLAELTARGPLAADQARALIGEAAVALEVARRRGVHHLALRPGAVRVTPDGSVLVTGLALDGELFARGIGDARSTTRADTVGLVALLYLCLTGRWPAPSGFEAAGVTTAPQVQGSPVPPAELSPAVPNDLDTLCAVTLGPHDDGPHSPAELVRELEPWGALSARDLLGPDDGPVAAAAPVVPPTGRGDRALPAEGSVQRQSVRSTFAENPTPAGPRPGTPPPAIPPSAHRARPPAETAAAAGLGAAAGAGVAAAVPPAPAPAPAPSGPTAPPPARPSAGAWGRQTEGDRPVSTSGPDRTSTSRPGGTAEDRRSEFDSFIDRPAQALTGVRFDPTPWVLGIVLLAVVIGVVVAYQRLTAPAPPIGGSDGFGNVQDVTPSATPTGESTEGTEEPATEEPAASTEPPAIASGQQLDPPPNGDNNEHPEAVDRAIDGDPETFWFSRTYVSPTYGMKEGIGYAITLETKALVTSVTLDVAGTGGNVEIRATTPGKPTTGDVLAQGPMGPSTEFVLSTPTEATTLVLWITELPQTSDGSNRIELREITVS